MLKRRHLPRILGVGFTVVLIVLITGAIIFLQPRPAAAEALAALHSDAQVTVTENGDLISLLPTGTPKGGFLFYPGGLVDAAAYGRVMRDIAEQGYAVFIVKMPLNLAILGIERGANVIAKHPEITKWAIGGHSLGGSMACRFAAGHPEVIGIVLYAAYCDGPGDLSGKPIEAASVSGSKDGLATPDKIEAGRPLLPPDTVYTVIEGGNHAYFGDYGPQRGDGEATIRREDAQRQIVAATLALLQKVG